MLYGLDRAKKAIVTAATVVVCEGYTDVIGFHRAGVPLAVAACGTSLTEEHVKLLRRFGARRFVLAFDADSAGQAAADRFYRWERDHDLEVAVADLPPGQDPGDLAQSDPERLATLVETARPFLRFRLDRAFADRRPDDAGGPGAGRPPGARHRGRAPRRAGPRPVHRGRGQPVPDRARPPARAVRAAPAGPGRRALPGHVAGRPSGAGAAGTGAR